MSAVSVIIPVYNTARYLDKCLNSVVSQTLKDIEIVCVNDGSTDDSLSILKKYAQQDSRIKIINKLNGGLSSARNMGLRHATSVYIGFVDSDDWIEPETYELALAHMREDIDIVCWGAKVENDIGESHRELVDNRTKYYQIKLTGTQEITDAVLLNSTVSACNKLYRKSVIDNYSVVFPEGLLFEDNAFFYQYMAHAEKGYYLDRYLYNIVQRAESIMERHFSGKSTAVTDKLRNFKHIYNHYAKYELLNKHRFLITRLFEQYLSEDYNNTRTKKLFVLRFAHQLSKKLDSAFFENSIVRQLQNKSYAKINCIDCPNVLINLSLFGLIYTDSRLHFLLANKKIIFDVKKIFSVRNQNCHKIICVFGKKIKFKRK